MQKNMKKVVNLKEKAMNDPENSGTYERKMWHLYKNLTNEKSGYLYLKDVENDYLCAFVTFRSM
jgi:hypothetical protein